MIRGGTVVDGTGGPTRRCDVGIEGDRVVRVGDVDIGPSTRVLDATGCIVTPGFVDIHSHLDAQIGWDPLMTSSCWHGVTSVVMGNCGMTFAPVRPGDAELLATAMESVEDIPARCILDGLNWEWESYGEYLDTIEQLPRGLNAGGYVGDVALRLYVAGDRACEPDYRASDAELSQMAALVEQSVAAGALGYSISRSLFHRVPDGRNVPGTWTDPAEFFAVAEPLRGLGRGVLESAPRYNFPDAPGDRVDEELAWMAQLSKITGRPFSFNLQQITSLGDHYRRVLDLCAQANADGAQLRAQITPRSVGVLFSLDGNSLLDDLASWQPFRNADHTAKLAAVRDPGLRQRLEAEGAHKTIDGHMSMFLMEAGAPVRYEFAESDSLGAHARAAGTSVVGFYLDEMDRSEGRSLVNWPVMNQNSDAIEEQIQSPVSIMGLADAGAHATQIMDASQSTYFLSHWVRERELLSLEEGVRRLTSDTASFVGYTDRGTLREGAFADVNVIDWDGLSLELPEIVNDFPGDAPRFIQKAQGYRHTLVNGVELLRDGEHTGELPGVLLRSGR